MLETDDVLEHVEWEYGSWTAVLVYDSWQAHRSPWYPTEATGPFATLVRGNFPTEQKAHEWARDHLNGGPYSVKFIPGC